MNTLFIIIFLLTFPTITFFAFRAIVSTVKKDKGQRTKFLKLSGITFAVMIASVVLVGVTADPVKIEQLKLERAERENAEKVATVALEEENAKKAEKEAAEVRSKAEEDAIELKTKQEDEAKAKFEAEQKAKAEVEAKKKADAEAKAKAEKVTALAEKDYYVKEVVPQMEGVMEVYDRIWTEIWQPTFTGMSNGTVNRYTAYENMKEVERRYTALGTQISNINGDKLSKENKKHLDEFKANLSNAASLRRSTGNEAKKMIDKGTFSPSEVDKVMSTVRYSDGPMINAAFSKTTIDINLGVLE